MIQRAGLTKGWNHFQGLGCAECDGNCFGELESDSGSTKSNLMLLGGALLVAYFLTR